VRRGRLAGSAFLPSRISGGTTKQNFAIHGKLQSEVRVDPTVLTEQIPNFVGVDLGLRPEYCDASPRRNPGTGSDLITDG
jgi:hypothetical protein